VHTARYRQEPDGEEVHLTLSGYLTTAGLAIPVAAGLATALAAWDPDQTYWLRDLNRERSTRQTWQYDRDHENWELAASP
jgi:hypothetical protein